MESALSEKQIAFRDYLLKKLGFMNNEFLESYLLEIEKTARRHILLAAIKDEEWDPKNERPYYSYKPKYKVWLPDKFGVVDFLMWEYKLKKDMSFREIYKPSQYLSATDFANFVFCIAGYSISKSFEGTKNTLAETGNEYHEEKILDIENRQLFRDKQQRSSDQYENNPPIYIDDNNRSFFDEIAGSDLIYSGHSDKEKEKYFINKEKSFIGQPDYIFLNAKGEYFVVEEKFKILLDDKRRAFFADHHRVQLESYIHYLKEYQVQFGYLVYWIYKYDDNGYRNLENCFVLRINKDLKIEAYLDKLTQRIKLFQQQKAYKIELDKLSPKKCANCVHVLICGHKNKRSDEVTFPYGVRNFRIYYAPYPEILKTQEKG